MTKANLKNPFGLTARECELMESLCRLGKTALVAKDLGISQITVQGMLQEINRKMCAPNTVLAVLKWDRRMQRKGSVEREAHQFEGARPPNSVFELGSRT